MDFTSFSGVFTPIRSVLGVDLLRLVGFLAEVPCKPAQGLGSASQRSFNEVRKEKAVGFFKGEHQDASDGARSRRAPRSGPACAGERHGARSPPASPRSAVAVLKPHAEKEEKAAKKPTVLWENGNDTVWQISAQNK